MSEKTNTLLSQYSEIKSIVQQIFSCIEKKNKQRQDSINMLKGLKNTLVEMQNIQSEIQNTDHKEQ